jgi:hypothetical protein
MGLHFKIVYKKGRDNLVADALSRLLPVWIQEVANSYVTDKQA